MLRAEMYRLRRFGRLQLRLQLRTPRTELQLRLRLFHLVIDAITITVGCNFQNKAYP